MTISLSHRVFLFFIFSTCVTQPAIAGETTRYLLLADGEEAGYQTVEYLPDGRLKVRLHADDNGRGSKLDATYSLDEAGIPTSLDITGKSWMQADVDEHFRIGPDGARWHSLSESGEYEGDETAFYFAEQATFQDPALLAGALARAPGNRLKLLPAGEAQATIVASFDVAGESLALHAIAGLDTTRWLYWLDDEGRLAAWIGGKSYFLVREDLRDAAMRIAERQFEYLATEEAGRMARFAQTASGLVVFRNVGVFDAERANVETGRDVYVYAGRITAVRPTGANIPNDARIIEGSGATLIPGLWDMHAHSYKADQGFQHIAFGVTSVREIGNGPEEILELKRMVDAGEVIGPRRVLAGFVEGRSEFSAKTGRIAASLEEALAAVDWYAGHGFDQIKVYNSIRPEWVEPIAERAHELGLRVSGHVPAFMTAEQAMDAGYDEINHINMLFLNFLQRSGDDTRTMLRFSRIGEEAAALDLDSPSVTQFIDRLKRQGVVIDATMNPFLDMMRSRPGKPDPQWQLILDRLPVVMRRSVDELALAVPAEQDENYNAAAVALQDMLRRLYEAGVTLVPGTDSNYVGMMMHIELNEWVNAGIPPAQALRAATIVSARVAGREHELGSIERGKLADLVLVDGNPARDIRDLRNIRLVMQGERLYDAPGMLRELNILP